MNTKSQDVGPGSRKGRRPIVVGTILTIGVLVIAVLVLRKSTSPSEADTVGSGNPVAPANAGSAVETAAGIPAKSPGEIVTQPTLQGQAGGSTNAGLQGGGVSQASVADLAKALKNASLPMAERKKAIKALAQLGSPEAIAALKEALASGSEDLRAAVAEGLGDCASPECNSMLLGLLNDPSETIVKAAIKGLAQQASPESIDALNKLVYDPTRSLDVRVASVDGLGNISQSAAFDNLSRAATTLTDEDMVKAVLEAIGSRNFQETQPFFQNYLRNPSVSSELRVDATEALAHAQGDPTAFLATLATDPDSDVRASAAWAMSATEVDGNMGPQLLGLIQAETDPDVRLRLYQALMNQDNVDPAGVLAAASNEKDPAALVTALNLVAKTLRDNPTPALQSFFDQTAVPALKNIALKADTSDERMEAMIALVRANNSSVLPTMQQIGQQTTDPKVARAANSYVAAFASTGGPAGGGTGR